MVLSPSSRDLLRTLGVAVPGEERARLEDGVTGLGPTIVKIADPARDVSDAIDLLDEATGDRATRRAVQRRRAAAGLGRDDQGRLTLDGRVCCGDLVRDIQRALPFLANPADLTCSCGTTYRVGYDVREVRRHGA